MDTLRSIFVDRAHEVTVDLLCHERDHGSSGLTDSHQSGIQCHIRIDLILLHALCPEALTGTANIPVTHIVHEILQRSGRFRNTVVSQVVVGITDSAVQSGQQPFIHNAEFFVVQSILRSIEIVNICIKNKESISIPQSTHEFSLAFHNSFSVETVGQPRCTVDVEIPADRVCSVGA